MDAGPAPVPPAQAAQSWTSGAKDLVMTALGTSRVWATIGWGIVNEVYWPAVDQPQVKDLGFLVGGSAGFSGFSGVAGVSGFSGVSGSGWWQEVKRSGRYTLSTPEPGLMLPAIVHTGTNQAYRLTLRPVVDPDHDALLIGYDLAGAGVRLYPLLAPHLGVSQITPEEQWPALGAGNRAWVEQDPASGPDLFARGNGHVLCLLARPGPVSGQDADRWEENPGASPFTIGLEVVALLVAATRLTGPDRALALALADNWNERLEEFTYISGDEVDQAFGTGGHYVRIGRPGGGRAVPAGQPPGSQPPGSQPPGTQPAGAAALIGLEFGYLPRLGLRDPADQRITDTLAIAEAMLGADTPSGRAYRRYDLDGYGEWLDGSGWPARKTGIGRPWPLLAGERGHLDVLAGGDAGAQLRAMLAMRGRGGLLPEQIWDVGPLLWRDLWPGRPTGSAMPLAWAHSELIKLAVVVATRKPVELLTLVADRYHAAVPAAQSWFWRDATPVRALPAGRTLVVAGPEPFTLHYGFDDWDPATITERDAQGLGLGLTGVTLTPADLAGRSSLQFVRRYPDGRWEPSTRHDVTLGAPGPATLRLSPAHQARLAAGGDAGNRIRS
jgi:hypothetical protein